MSAKKMNPIPRIPGRVHCHICPLKELCGIAQPDLSYRKAQTDRWEETWGCINSYEHEVPQKPRELDKEETEKLFRATRLCPLKGLL